MFSRLPLLLCSILWLSGCQLLPDPHSPDNQPVSAAGQLYLQTAAKLPAADQLPAYDALYQGYLQSGLIRANTIKWRELQDQLQQTDLNDCQALPWREWQQQHLLNMAFYRLALNCYEHHQLEAPAKSMRAYQAYLRNGILKTGNGRTHFSAYRIGVFSDAQELLMQLGMQVQTYHAMLASAGNSLYYEVYVYDPTDDHLKAIYFENQQYLHALDGVPYPFVGLVDGWRKELLPESAKTNPAMMVPLAKALSEEGDDLAAEQWLLKAIAGGSLQAQVNLAELCYSSKAALTTSKAQSLGWLMDAADQDYLPALHLLHLLHQQKLVTPADPEQLAALPYYINERAGAGHAEVRLARYLLQGKLVKADPATAIQLLKQAAAAGYPDAASFAILAQLEHQKLAPAEATAQLSSLAAEGSTSAAYLYVSDLMLQNELDPKARQQSRQLLQQAMQAWHPEAFYLYGFGIENGWFTDEHSAVHYYQLAAERFFGRAMLKLGQWYRTEKSAQHDPVQASRWFYLCTRQGVAACAYQAGVMLEDGEASEADPAGALRLYSFAAEQNYAPAVNRMALLYLFGKGTPADTAKAITLLQQAARLGSSSANYYLGLIYFEGEYTSRDLVKARKYFQQAGSHPTARYYLQNWNELSTSPPKR